MRYGYCRCLDCNVMDDIKKQTDKYISLGVLPDNIFFEYHSFELQPDVQIFKLFEVVKKGDIIVAPNMSRIARTVNQFLVFLNLCLEHKIIVEVEDFRMDFSNLSQDTRTLIKMLHSVKKNVLSQMTRRALENRTRSRKRIGAKKLVYSRIPTRVKTMYPLYKTGAITLVEYGIRCNLAASTIKRHIEIIKEYEKKKGEK